MWGTRVTEHLPQSRNVYFTPSVPPQMLLQALCLGRSVHQCLPTYRSLYSGLYWVVGVSTSFQQSLAFCVGLQQSCTGLYWCPVVSTHLCLSPTVSTGNYWFPTVLVVFDNLRQSVLVSSTLHLSLVVFC